MKYTKAEIEFIALENVDIIAASDATLDNIVIKYCQEVLKQGGWDKNDQCSYTVNKQGHWEDVKKYYNL